MEFLVRLACRPIFKSHICNCTVKILHHCFALGNGSSSTMHVIKAIRRQVQASLPQTLSTLRICHVLSPDYKCLSATLYMIYISYSSILDSLEDASPFLGSPARQALIPLFLGSSGVIHLSATLSLSLFASLSFHTCPIWRTCIKMRGPGTVGRVIKLVDNVGGVCELCPYKSFALPHALHSI